jgi:23S rRNA (uracil1939-C5)-methyltransferase
VQLHYDIKEKLLGQMNSQQKIIPIPHCLLPHPSLKSKIKHLYHNHSWLNYLDKKSPLKGHIELALKSSEKVEIYINRPYAAGGFTQINQNINQDLIHLITQIIHNDMDGNSFNHIHCLDLFSGQGNLTQKLNSNITVTSVDSFPSKMENFIQLNLFKTSSPPEKIKNQDYRWLILDPPRSGFKQLSTWIGVLKPKNILYISCNPWTLQRDLMQLFKNHSNYSIKSSYLLDMFPSTNHFECLVQLQLKN